jgi:GntR family transcriptional regulator
MSSQTRRPLPPRAGAQTGALSAAGPHATQGVPRYHRIADQLRARILAGDLAPGRRLPSETELMDASTVSRNTVRLALRLLLDEGLVTARQGQGTFVRARPQRLIWDLAATGQQWAAGVEAGGHRVSQHVEVSTAAALPAAARLGTDPAGVVLCWRRAVAVDGEPYLLAVDYLLLPVEPAGRGQYAPDVDTALIALGLAVTRHHHELAPRMPTRAEIDALRLHTGTPVVEHTRTGYADDRPVQVTVTVLPGDRHLVTLDVPAGPPGNQDSGEDRGEAARHEGGGLAERVDRPAAAAIGYDPALGATRAEPGEDTGGDETTLRRRQHGATQLVPDEHRTGRQQE